jgi:MOSC domain-containing protein YiiM
MGQWVIVAVDETVVPIVVGVSKDAQHRFSKQACERVTLLAGLGVEGDAHLGVTVQHRSRVAVDPTQPNLRQVHLIHSEFFDEARAHGYELAQGDLGENVLTAGLDLLALPRDTRLHLGPEAIVRVTGLRNPCQQINDFRSGLLKVAITRDSDGSLVRKAGIMGVVERGGDVIPTDVIRVELPPPPHIPLDRV